MKRLLSGLLSITALLSATVFGVSSSDIYLSAESAVLLLPETGQVIYKKNSDAVMPMASTTKIMTALVVLRRADDLSRPVKVSPDACGIEGSSVYLRPDEVLTVEELLYALLLESANDAAAALAIEVAGDIPAFAELMNEEARALGLTSTHFTNPHGLDGEGHYTTARELALITAAAMEDPVFKRIVSTEKASIPLEGVPDGRTLFNHNKLLCSYEGTVGVKTGFTKKSGRCLVSAAERDGVTLIAVTLNAPDDWNDHRTMLDFGFSSYRRFEAVRLGDRLCTLPVTGSTEGDSVSLICPSPLSIILPVGSDVPQCSIVAPRFLFAPVKEGDVCGYALFTLGDLVVGRLPLLAETSLDGPVKLSFWQKILSLYK